jgi:hypothetical protein
MRIYNAQRTGANMEIVVVGGHSRNIGKTSVMAGLIRRISPPKWTAVKITQYGHGICSLDGGPCDCAPTEHSFVLTEEKKRDGRGDSRRFLASGARRSLWLRVRQGQLDRAFPALQQALRSEEWVMVESNSILALLEPALYLFVLDRAEQDFKESARKYLARADAVVAPQPIPAVYGWPGIEDALLRNKPVFPVSRLDYANPCLDAFVRQRLGLPEAAAT